MLSQTSRIHSPHQITAAVLITSIIVNFYGEMKKEGLPQEDEKEQLPEAEAENV